MHKPRNYDTKGRILMKTFVVKLQTAKLAVFSAGLFVLLITAFTVGRHSSADTKLYPIYGVNTDKPYIALTFDCAWEDSDLDEISDILTQNNVPATFFVTGEFANNYKERLKRLYNNGHEIGNHSYSHPHVASISKSALINDTLKCSEAIKQAVGEYPKLYRVPYGEYNNETLKTLEELSLPVIQWDCDSCDWKPGITVKDIENRISKNLQNGSILLFHVDSKPKQTANALKKIIPKIKIGGYEFKTVSEIIYQKPYSVDNTGRISKSN